MDRTIEDLRIKQALPLEMKVQLTQLRIEKWYNYWCGNVFVSFSGGKDSTVLLHLVREMYPDVPTVFVNTGLEYPEVVAHVKTFDNVIWLRPKMNFRQVIEKYGYPVISKEIAKNVEYTKKWFKDQTISDYYVKRLTGTLRTSDGRKSMYCCDKWMTLLFAPFNVSNKCCQIMKKAPLHQMGKTSAPITGMMAEESKNRESMWLMTGCNAFESNPPISKPMAFWTEQDVLNYILQNNIKIADCYGEVVPKDYQYTFDNQQYMCSGCDRTGCMFCCFGVQLDKHPNRFERMQQTHPKIYSYCMKSWESGGLGLDYVLNWLDIPH